MLFRSKYGLSLDIYLLNGERRHERLKRLHCARDSPPCSPASPSALTHSDKSLVFSTHSRPPDSSSGVAPPESFSSRGRAQPVPFIGVGVLQLSPECTYGCMYVSHRSQTTQIRTCIVFLDHVQNLHIHAVRAKILRSIFELEGRTT